MKLDSIIFSFIKSSRSEYEPILVIITKPTFNTDELQANVQITEDTTMTRRHKTDLPELTGENKATIKPHKRN